MYRWRSGQIVGAEDLEDTKMVTRLERPDVRHRPHFSVISIKPQSKIVYWGLF